MFKLNSIPKEWLALILIAILVIGISLFEWKKTAVKTPQGSQNSGQDTLGEVILSEAKGSPDGGGTSKRLEKEENNVTVIIEYLPSRQAGLPDKSKSQLFFRIALDTHTVNLDSFDFGKDITLEKDLPAGRQVGKSFSPTLLNQEGGGHHRSAEITFPQTSAPFTIVFKNLSQIPRREFLFEKL